MPRVRMFRRKRGRKTRTPPVGKVTEDDDEASFFVIEKTTSSALSSLSSISVSSKFAAHGEQKHWKNMSSISSLSLLSASASISTGGSSSTNTISYKGSSVEVQKKWRKAQKGDTCAQYWLGDQYRTGLTQGIPQDEKEAFFWYAMAAEQGLAKAQFMLGLCYEKGRGVAEDVENAIEYYQRAADQGDSFARARLEGTIMERFQNKKEKKKKNETRQREKEAIQSQESPIVAGNDSLRDNSVGIQDGHVGDQAERVRQPNIMGEEASYMLVWRHDQRGVSRKSACF